MGNALLDMEPPLRWTSAPVLLVDAHSPAMSKQRRGASSHDPAVLRCAGFVAPLLHERGVADEIIVC